MNVVPVHILPISLILHVRQKKKESHVIVEKSEEYYFLMKYC